MSLKESIAKAFINHKSLRDVARVILNQAMKSDTVREIVIRQVIAATVKPSENILKIGLNMGKEAYIRKIFTDENHRETALDYLEKALEHEPTRNLLLSSLK